MARSPRRCSQAARVDAEPRHRLSEDALALAHGECLEGFVFQVPHGGALVVIAYPALKAGVATAGGVGERRAQARAVDGRAGEAKALHGVRLSRRPPVE